VFLVTPDTVTNPSLLEMRQVPRRFLGRGLLLPRRGGNAALVARLVFEVEILRYLGALLPFVVAALVWRDQALAISQAPLLMVLVVYFVEMKLLRVPPARRAALIDPDDAARGLDLLRVRAMAILGQIAAGRGMAEGRLHLVVEQSDLARLPPLTFVSVQAETGAASPEVLRLTKDERALIAGTLFQPPLDERRLHLIGLARDEGLHDIALDVSTLSAHARLSALMATEPC
jgi:hypothetical protein